MPRHIYVHIPYCLKKCAYCAFSSVECSQPPSERYIAAVLTEAGRADCDNQPIKTLYLGGGTPSLLTPSAVAHLIEDFEQRWGFEPGSEITIEINPETIDPTKAQGLKTAGVNRVSLGVQSLNERLLKILGRIHSTARTRTAVADLRRAGFANLSLDLIYAMPGQSISELEQDLKQLIELEPEHVSAYMFSHEPGTAFEDSPPQPEDFCEASFMLVRETLAAAGYAPYEISNFARPGYRSRHNQAYWAGSLYLGLGAAAVGRYQPNCRYRNLAEPEDYMLAIEEGRPAVAETDDLDQAALDLERRFLNLRTAEGLELAEFPAGIPPEYYEVINGRAVLTVKGLLVSDEIFSLL